MEIWEKIEKDKLTILDLWTIILKRKMLISLFTIIPILIVVIYFVSLPPSYQGEAVLGLVRTDRILVDIPETKRVVDIAVKKWKEGEAPRGFKADLAKKIQHVYTEEILDSISHVKMIVRSTGDAREVNDIFVGIKVSIGLSDYAATQMDFYNAKYNAQIKETKRMLQDAIETKRKTWLLMNQTNNFSLNPMDLDVVINDLKMKLLKSEADLLELKNYRYVEGPHIAPFNIIPKLRLYILIFGLSGFLAGLFIAFFLEIKSSLKLV